MHQVRDEVYVALGTPSPTLSTERLLQSKPQQQQSQIMDVGAKGRVVETSTLLQVAVVSEGEVIKMLMRYSVLLSSSPYLARLLAKADSDT